MDTTPTHLADAAPIPSLKSTIISSIFLGPFGAIWASRAADRARAAGHPTSRYWTAWVVSWLSLTTLSVALTVATPLILLAALGTANTSNASADRPQIYTPQTTPPPVTSAPYTPTRAPAPTITDATAPLTLPAGAVACPDSARTSTDAPYQHAARGNDITSCAFAESVRQAYIASSPTNGGTLQAHSPVTGKDYAMVCTGTTPVSCVGGNNALVLIY